MITFEPLYMHLNLNMNRIIFFCFVLILLFNSCAKSVDNNVVAYNNDFETGNLAGIKNGVISPFNGSKVLGNYNDGQFDLTISDLPTHDLIDVSFDLYIHDNWVGAQQFQNNSGPDIWQMKIDNKLYINTTFCNYSCIVGNFCPPQSFPADYPNQSYNPKSGASVTGLPGFCDANSEVGTTLYKIHKSISHSDKTLLIQCLDLLKSKGVADAKCNQSWSVDNIKVRAISIN